METNQFILRILSSYSTSDQMSVGDLVLLMAQVGKDLSLAHHMHVSWGLVSSSVVSKQA